MRKTLVFYFLMILSIALLAGISDMQFDISSSVIFSRNLHLLIESVFFLSILFVCIKSKSLYAKTKDNRFLVLAYGFLFGLIFSVFHAVFMDVFPFDNLFYENIKKNPILVYHMIANLIFSLTIYGALLYKSKPVEGESHEKPISIQPYLYGFIALLILPLFVYYFIPQILMRVYAAISVLQYINYAIYFMTAAILINSRINNNQSPINTFIAGLLLLGSSGLFYINPLSIDINGIFAHGFQVLGTVLIVIGLKDFTSLAISLRIKDELIAYLSLVLVAFYVAVVPVVSGVYKVIIPQQAGYLFIEWLLLFQLVIYAFSSISWKKVTSIYNQAERDRTLVRVFESMRRVQNQSIVKDTIVSEVSKVFNPNECFIVIYNSDSNNFYYDRYSEKLPSKTLTDSGELDKHSADFQEFQNTFHNANINFACIDEYLGECSLKGSPQEKYLNDRDIKSLYSIPIDNENKLLGYLILRYKNECKSLSHDEVIFLNKMAEQIGLLINSQPA